MALTICIFVLGDIIGTLVFLSPETRNVAARVSGGGRGGGGASEFKVQNLI